MAVLSHLSPEPRRRDRRSWPLDGRDEAYEYSLDVNEHVCRKCNSPDIAHVLIQYDHRAERSYRVLGFLCEPCMKAQRLAWRREDERSRRAYARHDDENGI